MAGIIVELVISWLLLWLIFKNNLSVLGFRPTDCRVLLYPVSIMTTAFINNNWVLHKQVTGKIMVENTQRTFVSVLYEELIFRGALLYIAIKKFGAIWAFIISAVGFGIYHWFTFNALGNLSIMIIIFLMTAVVGFSWAFAFAKTGSLYLPIGLHFGRNLFDTVIFSNGNFKQGIFIRLNDNHLQGIPSLLVFLFQIFALPILTFWYLRWLSKKRQNQVANINQ